MNSLKHGLRIESLALPGEDAQTLRDLLADWNDFYQPASPGERTLLEQAVTAHLQQRRALGYQTAHLNIQIRSAERRWDEAREDEVAGLVRLLATDPATAVRALGRTGDGCRWMIARWESLDARLRDDHGWGVADRDEALRLEGFRPAGDPPRPPAEAAEVCRRSAPILLDAPGVATEPIVVDVRALLLSPEWNAPRRTPDADADAAERAERSGCVAWLRARIAAVLGALRQREPRLRRAFDAPERAEAGARSQVLEGPVGATWLRYERMHALAFHRADTTFLRGRKEAAETGLAPGAPNEANEPEEEDLIAGGEPTSIAGSGAEMGPARRPPGASSAAGPGGAISPRAALVRAVLAAAARRKEALLASGSDAIASVAETAAAAGRQAASLAHRAGDHASGAGRDGAAAGGGAAGG